ncbi:hypothetical protein GLYMA_12G112100v4 [Glycine max]|uniref:Secreted protein n=1 Tax=Glycine max TaxID=3847 RepID=K7LU76_SOYBN|nr:hypothetical protein GYH30_033395 [Glycine max]KRH25564.1 hypothetical protein GLYMA_12G112100v4 [Glycine max]
MGHAVSFLFSLTRLLYLCLASYVHLGVEIFNKKCFFLVKNCLVFNGRALTLRTETDKVTSSILVLIIEILISMCLIDGNKHLLHLTLLCSTLTHATIFHSS